MKKINIETELRFSRARSITMHSNVHVSLCEGSARYNACRITSPKNCVLPNPAMYCDMNTVPSATVYVMGGFSQYLGAKFHLTCRNLI